MGRGRWRGEGKWEGGGRERVKCIIRETMVGSWRQKKDKEERMEETRRSREERLNDGGQSEG